MILDSEESKLFPGARILARGEEWVIRQNDPSSDGGRVLACDGLSELVRGRQTFLLTNLERSIKCISPEETKLVSDESPNFIDSMLYVESQLSKQVPNDPYIHLGDLSVMRTAPYQLDPAQIALAQPRQRILIADAVGLGKTLESGILTTELMARGRGRRILVVTQKAMLTQFQKEFWSRFTIPLVRLDSNGLQRIRQKIPSNHNPFNYYDKTIISIDTLRGNLEYKNYLESSWWDIIIIDECHNVAARGAEGSLSARARVAKKLAARCDSLILLSATPHDGSAQSFASLINLLDPTAAPDEDSLTKEALEQKGLVVRRFKHDIASTVQDDFKERIVEEVAVLLSPAEEAAFHALFEVPFTQRGEKLAGKSANLQRVGYQKGILSSPRAGLVSLQQRIKNLQSKDQPTADELAEINGLEYVCEKLALIGKEQFTKYQRLVKNLKSGDWDRKNPSDRIVIFSERIETLEFLKESLSEDLKLNDKELAVLTGKMSDSEQQEIVDQFGRESSPLRVLLCSDVASEGLNLHYFCHRLVHFELPWSLMVFQQRNGRVDRFGQTEQPIIIYMMSKSSSDDLAADLRVYEILLRKEQQAYEDIGDPALFMNLHDTQKEEEAVAEVIAGDGLDDWEAFMDGRLEEIKSDSKGLDAATSLLNASIGKVSTDSSCISTTRSTSLFGGFASRDRAFFSNLLERLKATRDNTLNYREEDSVVTLSAPEDLRYRLEMILPKEVWNSGGEYKLSSSLQVMNSAIERARQASSEENTWPEIQYLWRQNPVFQWACDRAQTFVKRGEAFYVESDSFNGIPTSYLFLSTIPNKKGQPVILEWQVVQALDGKNFNVISFNEFLKASNFSFENKRSLHNFGSTQAKREAAEKLVPTAVEQMKIFMQDKHKEFSTTTGRALKEKLDQLALLKQKQTEQLELRFEASRELEQIKQSKKAGKLSEINGFFDEYESWVENTMTIESNAYIQLVCVFNARS